MGEPRHAIHARDAHIWTLRMALVFLTVICVCLLGVIYHKQNRFTIQVPPDLTKGALIKPGELQIPNSYAFAHYIWQQINEWPVSGKADYPKKIKDYACYLSPSFLKWLEANHTEKLSRGELERTRTMTSTHVYDKAFVQPMGNNTFNINLSMRVTERILEQKTDTPLKDIELVYPLRVVSDNRSCNEMGMALDGFFEQPRRVGGE